MNRPGSTGMMRAASDFARLPSILRTSLSSRCSLRSLPHRAIVVPKAKDASRKVVARASGDEDPPPIDEDVRDFRARLVARERAGEGDEEGGAADAQAEGGGGWAYETPLIEKGAVLLGGTKQVFGFGLRQQYFHKHDESFTKGVILNRPTGLKLDGWDIWFGGDVQEGGMFRGRQLRDPIAMQDLPAEVVCLHQLETPDVLEASSRVIKNIQSLPFAEAQALVAAGKAEKSDFWTFVGYCGWGRNQLQTELERDSWYMAAADSSLLLQELLSMASDPASLPRVTEEGGGAALAPGGDGIATWETLMRNIGRVAEVEDSIFEDSMLREWVRQKLADGGGGSKGPGGDGDGGAAASSSASSSSSSSRREPLEELEVGTLLLSVPGVDAPAGILEQQYLHKSLLLVVERTEGLCLAVVLNRPTSTGVQLELESPGDDMTVRIRFGGEAAFRGREPYMCLLPTEDAPLDATALGSSGISRVGNMLPSPERSSSLQVVRGFCYWEGRGLEQEVASGRYEVVSPESVPWEALWGLCGDDQGSGLSSAAAGWTPASIGMSVWQECRDNHERRRRVASPGSDEDPCEGDEERRGVGALDIGLSLGDLALLEWAKFFAK